MNILKKILIIALIAGVAFVAYSQFQGTEPVERSGIVQNTNKTSAKTLETAPEATQAVETEKMIVDTSSSQKQPTKTQKNENQQGEHIPFTQKEVEAGNPASYKETVGQCPFYEMAGEKGCVPPPDIECNADWSICKMKGGE